MFLVKIEVSKISQFTSFRKYSLVKNLQRFEMVQVTFLRKGAGVSDFTRASRGCIEKECEKSTICCKMI